MHRKCDLIDFPISVLIDDFENFDSEEETIHEEIVIKALVIEC